MRAVRHGHLTQHSTVLSRGTDNHQSLSTEASPRRTCDDVDVVLGVKHFSEGQQVRVLPYHMHHSNLLVHEVEIFLAGISADHFHGHSL